MPDEILEGDYQMNQLDVLIRDFLQTEDKETYLCRSIAIGEGHSIQEADSCVDGHVGCRGCPFGEGIDSEIRGFSESSVA